LERGSRILITGGAGFIGSHLADELLERGYRVRVLDGLESQVHGPGRDAPDYLSDEVELIVGDVRDADAVRKCLDGVDGVVHLAAAVGVGQSMYRIEKYIAVNDGGTATLMEALAARPIRRLVVASSMSIYGEGLYRAPDGTLDEGCERSRKGLVEGHWEVVNDRGETLEPLPTPEGKRPSLSSVYALTKYVQERLCLITGSAYGIPTLALRFFNVYGPRQALSNPYTGVMAIFASRYLNGKRPLVFEDGLQRRDFVSVKDAALACRLALEIPEPPERCFNIGSGESRTIHELALRMAAVMGVPEIEPEVTGKYRVGDIRHCFADIGRAREFLGYTPRVTLDEGLLELAGWLEGRIAPDRAEVAARELAERGLTV
jgi:dTDP-L-rhamnose 4-epimerase